MRLYALFIIGILFVTRRLGKVSFWDNEQQARLDCGEALDLRKMILIQKEDMQEMRDALSYLLGFIEQEEVGFSDERDALAKLDSYLKDDL
jgi:hypothetical protein